MDGKFIPSRALSRIQIHLPGKTFALVSAIESILNIAEDHYLMRSEENAFIHACNLQFILPLVIFKACILLT